MSDHLLKLQVLVRYSSDILYKYPCDRPEFVAACETGGREVYFFMWKCFQAADVDRDGLVSEEEFDKMILMATANIKR